MGTRWYPATVLALHADGRCDVAYDDGDREVGVLGRYVKPLPAALESALREAAEEAKQAKEEARACWRPPQMDSWRATDVPIGEGHQASLPDWEGPPTTRRRRRRRRRARGGGGGAAAAALRQVADGVQGRPPPARRHVRRVVLGH